jgi:hypothetical protein
MCSLKFLYALLALFHFLALMVLASQDSPVYALGPETTADRRYRTMFHLLNLQNVMHVWQ